MARGWQLGRQARTFFGTDWKQLWTTPLSEVRAMLGLERGVDELPPELPRQDNAQPMARARASTWLPRGGPAPPGRRSDTVEAPELADEVRRVGVAHALG